MKTDPDQNVIKKVERTMARYGMVAPGDRVVVAVSGGPDSVCLLNILYGLRQALEVELAVAHLDHGLRPAVDEDETRFVASLAHDLNLPFFTQKLKEALNPGDASLEEKAREFRYRFFDQVKSRASAQKIALGHTLDDQAETVLMRLLRGSGPSGLSGIPPVRDNTIIRPLIEMTRGEVQGYLQKRRLHYMTDASNADPTYLRNHIRLNLMPRLEAIQPRVVERLAQTADIMRAEKAYLEQEASRWLDKAANRGEGGEVQLPLADFKALPEALKRQVIRKAICMTGSTLRRVNLQHIKAVEQLALTSNPHARIALPHGMVAKRRYDQIHFTPHESGSRKDFSRRIESPGQWDIDVPAGTLFLEPVDPQSVSDMAHPWRTAYLDRDLIQYPLTLRNFRPGDRFIPLGMSGHKKVKDFFIDLKIPVEQRSLIPILAQGDRIVWICGYRLDDRFKVTPQTKQVLKVFFEPREPIPGFSSEP